MTCEKPESVVREPFTFTATISDGGRHIEFDVPHIDDWQTRRRVSDFFEVVQTMLDLELQSHLVSALGEVARRDARSALVGIAIEQFRRERSVREEEATEERAAIIEFDAYRTRADAERLAGQRRRP
jgi:hypothetical protein